MDFLWAALFLLWCEALSLPLRWAMAGWRAPADLRRMLSRLAGPPLVAMPLWFAAHAGRGPLERGAGFAALGLAGALGLYAGLRQTRSPARLLAYEGGHPARQAALDALMVALMLGFAAFRRYVPELTTYTLDSSAAEKFANAMFFWSNWNARQLPPEDYWLAGNPLPYYYWGHFFWAYVARLGGFRAVLAPNLALAMVVALTWTSAYALARAVRLPWAWAAGAALCVTWAGNPESLAHLADWMRSGFRLGAYDYWGPSRAIANVVDEFPAFSAILGDFHAHHLALPWLTGWLALSAARWRSGGHGLSALTWVLSWGALGAAAVLTNLWNLPLVALCAAALLALSGGLCCAKAHRAALRRLGLAALLLAAAILAGMRLLRSGAPLPIPADAAPGILARLHLRALAPELRSSLSNLFAMWGLPASALALGALARLFRRPTAGAATAGPERFRSAALAAAGALLIFAHATPLGSRIPGGTAWVGVGVALWVAALASGRRAWLSRPAAFLALGGCAVLSGLELLYMPDRYVGVLARYNSYFKFTYPVWPVLWVAAWAASRRLWRARLSAPVALPARSALVALALLSSVYTARAMPARIAMARAGDAPPRHLTLNAFDFTRHRPFSAPESPLIRFIRRHVPVEDRVAEAGWTRSDEAMAYKYQGRIASLAGRAVPVGWAHHEQQWRGPAGYGAIDRRIAEVNALYRSAEPGELRERAAALGVRWIVYGVAEAQAYGPGPLEVLRATFPVVAAFPRDNPAAFLFRVAELDIGSP
jgi:YYY domain-containing protein